MRVLLLSRYGDLGASSRQRFSQFIPGLAAAGIEVTTQILLDDDYVRALYAGGKTGRLPILRAYLSRLRAGHESGRFDGVWIEKEVFPWLPFGAERLMLPRGVPVVVDFDDAWFHRYDGHPNRLARLVLGRKIDRVMAAADLVIAGNAYIAARATTALAKRVEILPTVVDVARFGPRHPGDRFTIGWIGTPGTSHYLETLREPLSQLAREAPTRIVLIGAAPGTLDGLSAEIRPWAAAMEADELSRLSVGIMPLPDTPWERGKCGYKLIQYMAADLPAVASPVGANSDIIRHGETGFLATTGEEWLHALRRLRDDPALGASFGAAGRTRAEAEYSLDYALPRLIRLLRQTFG